MLPPPQPPGPPSESASRRGAIKQRAGLPVLAVALAVLLALIALVWYVNEHDSDDDLPSRRPAAATATGTVLAPG